MSLLSGKTLPLVALLACGAAVAAPAPVPDRGEGEGPFGRLVLRGVTIVNGEGAPPIGPADLVIEGNRIAEIVMVGSPGLPVKPDRQAETGPEDRVMNLEGHYVLPGFVDLHAHFGGDAQGVPGEYPAKLWLAHGITTIREPGSGNFDWDCPGLQWSAERNDGANHWRAYIVVPWRSIGAAGDTLPPTWRANFYRIERPRSQSPEFSCWSPTMSEPADFHRPAYFGHLQLAST